eukprot:Protomagalhaensia_sp_Gyna_25__5395@NODE_699_length_2818_cov_94_373875_g546_i0_p1_GENE_NODE_699_length_2818_cov_94_373875_g546_i0NODE_699_length_2818_cov_94_373875_g546_i0_p1_ORF_typecomplete_len434_score57_34Lectin_leglike/PF03388_13/3_1e21GP41/PF00517_17/3_5GP41/PF00517_17/1_4e02_NODE_699_length_2818_cov_94_373875_g546_i0941395
MWVPWLAALLGAAAQQPIASSKQWYQSPVHSIYGGEVVPRAWVTHNVQLGAATTTQEESSGTASSVVQLSRRDVDKNFYMFNRYPISQPGFEIQFELQVVGPPETKNGDGLVVWLAEERDPSVFYRPPDKNVWNFFGYKPNFSGFAVFFATSDRANQPTASISAAYSNGTRVWDATTGVPSNDGIYYNFRNSATPFVFKVSVHNDVIKGSIRAITDKDAKQAFIVKIPPNTWGSRNFYLGLSASNRRTPPGEKTPAHTQNGDSITIKNFRLLTEDSSMAVRNEVPGQDVLRNHTQNPTADALSLMRGLADVVDRFLLPQQEHILNQLSLLEHKNELLGDRLDILHAYLTKGSLDPELKKAVETMGTVLNRQNSRLAELKGVRELQERSASLESTIKSHAQLSSTLTIALGGVFVVFGVVIYKRMRDMEKKHIL